MKVNIFFKGLFFYFISLLFFSCDFSSQLHKEILSAQDKIGEQKYHDSIQRYENILKLYPPKKVLVKIYFQLGELYSIHHGEPKTAIMYFDKLKEVTEDPSWLVKAEEKIGEINFTYLRNFEEAEKNYRRLVSFSPILKKHDYYEFRLGVTLVEQNKIILAENLFRRIGQDFQHEFNVLAFYYLGMVSFQNRNWKESIEHWREYLKRESRKEKIIQTKFLMANSFETMESLEEAYDLYYSILGDYPNTELIKNRLKSLYSRRMARKR